LLTELTIVNTLTPNATSFYLSISHTRSACLCGEWRRCVLMFKSWSFHKVRSMLMHTNT